MAENRRRTILVDRKFQLYYLGIWLGTGLLMVAVAAVFYYFFFRPHLGHYSTGIMTRIVIGMGAFIILFCCLMGVLAVVLTHKVAGAAYRVNKSLLEWMEGKLDTDIHLRKKDYLQALATNMNQFRTALKARAEEAEKISSELEALKGALGEENHRALEEIRVRIRALSTQTPPE